MHQHRSTDPSFCACCATDFAPEQLVWAGLVYSKAVMVCNLACLCMLVTRWAPTPWWRRVLTRARWYATRRLR